MEDVTVDMLFDFNLDFYLSLPLLWGLSHEAAAPEEQSSRRANLTEHTHSHYSGGAIGASVVENRKSRGSTPHDEEMGNAPPEAVRKPALASPSSNTSGATSPQSAMSHDTLIEGDGELKQYAHFEKFLKGVLGNPRQYAVLPACSRPTWRNGEPITLGIIFAARAHLLEEILKRKGIDIPADPALIGFAMIGFLNIFSHDSEPALLELMSERNFAANTTTPSALPASSHSQSESQNADSPSDFDPSSQANSITARDSSSASREPTPVPKSQKKPVHSCPTCAKHFSRSSTLARHAKSHHNVKDYRCAVCPRAFSRKDLLNRHMSLHDRGAKWVCGAYSLYGLRPGWGCGREFARVDDLKRHFGSQKGQLCRKLPFPLSKDGVATLAHSCSVDNE